MRRGPYALRLVAFAQRHREPKPWRTLWHLASAFRGHKDGGHQLHRTLLCGRTVHYTQTMEEATFESAPAGDRCAHCERALGRVLGAWFGGSR